MREFRGAESKVDSSEMSTRGDGCARQEAAISGRSESEITVEQGSQGSRGTMIADQEEKKEDEAGAETRSSRSCESRRGGACYARECEGGRGTRC